MGAVLIVSADPDSLARIETAAKGAGLRFRSVVSLEDAEKWLAMQDYQALLVDARYEDGAALKLIDEAWKLNPLLVGGIFNLQGPARDAAMARVLGVRVYQGTTALSGITQMFEALPEKFTLGENFSVLVVEDLDSPRDIICSYIEALGYPRVEGASGAEEALKKLAANPQGFLCVITDINMPKVSGVKLIEQIRQNNQTAHLPVVVLSAYATAENLLACIQVGATGFLVKPPRKNLLRQELERARRILLSGESPWLCDPQDQAALEAAMQKYVR